jgi:hypothetical protein
MRSDPDPAGLLRCAAGRGGFAGLPSDDAKPIAVAICFDICNRDDAADFLRNRARNALAGTDNMTWVDRAAAAGAMTIAATVLGL